MIRDRRDILCRDQRILVMYYLRGIHRKQIALMMKMQYEAVKKVIQKASPLTPSDNLIVAEL